MSDTELEVLLEIRDLLMLIAEPQIAERDKSMREEICKIVRKSEKNKRAILLMDGTRNQTAIAKEVPMDVSNLNKLVKALSEANLLKINANPAIVIPVTQLMFMEDK